jgi:hypothetical protein
MQKRIVLLIIFMVLNLNIYSQVVIKDEIVLDETNTDEAGLTMPFYGKVGEVIFQNNLVCQNTKSFLIVDLTEYPFGPCQGLTCGQYISCFCVAGNPYKNVTNVSMGTTIDTKFLKCTIINGEWIEYELEHYFQLILPNDADVSYQILARLNESSPWVEVGRMNFTKTTPPGCDSAQNQYCDENFNEDMPPTEVVEHDKTFTGLDYCSKPDRLAFFTPAWYPKDKWSNISNLTLQDISVCFDLQTQAWKFKVSVDKSEFNVIIDTCKNNIESWPATVIGSLEEVNNIPLYKCLTALESFVGHRHYPYEIPRDGYVIKEVLFLHESKHKEKWNEYLQKFLPNYLNIFYDVSPSCQSYADPTDAAQNALNLLNEKFSLFYNNFNNKYKWEIGLDDTNPDWEILRDKEERRANNHPEVRSKVYDYINALINHCFY